MKRKLVVVFSVLILLIIGLYIFAYAYMNRSAAYLAAVEFLSSHTDLKSSLGENTSYQLAYTGWALTFLGPEGKAHFKIYAIGAKRSGTVFVYLISHAGQWKVKESNLFLNDGKSIRLHE